MIRFRFAKRPQKANDRTRRYRILRGEEREHVGELEIAEDTPSGITAVSLFCFANLVGTGREIALGDARRFVDELAAGWGRQLVEAPGGTWVELPESRSVIRLGYRPANL
jgi:hypothetical protein